MYLSAFFASILALSFPLSSAAAYSFRNVERRSDILGEAEGQDTEEELDEEQEEVVEESGTVRTTLSLIAVGDNLIHTPIFESARQADGTYDFTHCYVNVKDTIQSYDLAVINQETIFVNNPARVSSYPTFGTPSSMGYALMDAGFDVILSASNHTLDKGKEGFYDTINFWKNYPEITLLGIHESVEDYNTIDIVEKNGFRLAMFNYTYGTNGIPVPRDIPFAVDLLSNKGKLLGDIQSVEGSVDFTVCFLHIGEEYTHTPTAYQVNYINEVIDAGADLVICAHPHVIEPYGMVTTANGNQALVYYSCGNFISTQTRIPRTLGGMASVELYKTTDGENVTEKGIASYDFIPVVSHFNGRDHTVYKLEDYTEELAATHYLASSGFSVAALWNVWHSVVG